MTIVVLGTTEGPGFMPSLEVFTPYATGLVDWFTTEKTPTHTFRGLPVGRDAGPVDITVARQHLVYILTEAK